MAWVREVPMACASVRVSVRRSTGLQLCVRIVDSKVRHSYGLRMPIASLPEHRLSVPPLGKYPPHVYENHVTFSDSISCLCQHLSDKNLSCSTR